MKQSYWAVVLGEASAVRRHTRISISRPASCSQCGLSLPWSAALPEKALPNLGANQRNNLIRGNAEYNLLGGLQLGRVMVELRLVCSQAGLSTACTSSTHCIAA